jgi:hypothetical protein
MTLQPDHWLQLDAKFTNVGSGDFRMSSSLYDLGSSGLASPQLLGFYFANGVGDPSLTAGSETFSNPDMTSPVMLGSPSLPTAEFRERITSPYRA